MIQKTKTLQSKSPLHGKPPSQLGRAIEDVYSSVTQPRLWVHLAWRDINVQFERSFLGPFWMAFQAAAWVGAIVFVFGGIMGPHREYTIYVAIGIVLYNFITVIMTDSSDIFIRNRIAIHSHPNPYFSYVLRQVMYAIIQLIIQSSVVVIAFIMMQTAITPVAIWAVLGLFSGILMGICLALSFSLLGLRFGDFRFLMLAVMRLGLFVTPILWTVESGGGLKRLAAHINPMAHFINTIRMPLMGELPPLESYIVVGGSIVFCLVLSSFLFVKLRRSIPMWI